MLISGNWQSLINPGLKGNIEINIPDNYENFPEFSTLVKIKFDSSNEGKYFLMNTIYENTNIYGFRFSMKEKKVSPSRIIIATKDFKEWSGDLFCSFPSDTIKLFLKSDEKK
jgi:hypothetical protein